MKTFNKALLVALVAIFSFGYASADFRFGFKAGLNFNKLNLKIQNAQQVVNLAKDKGNQTGLMAGFMAEFTIPIVNIGADASILYAHQSDGNVKVDGKDMYDQKNFIDIPVNLKWKIGLPVVGKFISPIIYTGPDFLFALNKNTLDAFKSRICEVGWNIGIGVELLKHFQIEAGYCIGLNNIVDKTNDFTNIGITPADYKLKKNYWTVTAAYLF